MFYWWVNITSLLTVFGVQNQNLLANHHVPVFWFINCFIDLWQGCGYGAIVYCAAIASVNPNLHEAAVMDGANKWKRLLHITIPTITPLVVTMFTLKVGLVFTQGFDKVLLLYMPSTYVTADCLATYTYRIAFADSYADFGLSAASGLFQSVIATALLLFSNWLTQRATHSSRF